MAILPQALRRLTPPRVRDDVRLRALAVGLGLIPPRTMHSPADARVLLDAARGARRVVEIGVYEGASALALLAALGAGAELHLIDLDLSALDPIVANDHRVALYGSMSHLALEGFPKAYFDWIYIDGDHSYAGVMATRRHVKPGGLLVFNDFAHIDPLLGPMACTAPSCTLP